jgi:endo-1,3(4)-beta-glucanase
MNSYMLMSPGNTIQPQPFVPNFVSGILFMNKADHTSYFGIPNSPTGNLELTHGIHMIPLTPISPFIRLQSFVTAEWQAKLAAIVDQVNSGWRGILMANLAISDPQTAWTFFTTGFQSSLWLDDGASLTWYLALTAGLLAGGNPATSPATGTAAAAATASISTPTAPAGGDSALRDGQHVL